MEPIKCNSGNNFLVKTWKRCQCKGGLAKIKSWSGREKTKQKVTPKGFFPVCVGPDKQRFAVKIKYFSHPLFTEIVEEAVENKYVFEGAIFLPCDLDLFCKVLAEIKSEEEPALGWSSTFAYGSCSPFNPSRRLRNNGADEMVKSGYGSYGRLTH